MIGPQGLAAWPALSGTVFLAGWFGGWLVGFGPPSLENRRAESIADSRTTSVTVGAEHVKTLRVPPIAKDSDTTADLGIVDSALGDLGPRLPPATPVQVALGMMPDTARNNVMEAVGPVRVHDECLGSEACMDEYLWSLYQRTPKVDVQRVLEQVKTTVKKKGKTRTVIKTATKLVDEDFTWKDPKAAQKAGMPLKDYVIGGMDRSFRLKLYRALRAMDEAGLAPGITSAFRDDYRQSIVSGTKAATDSSYHGGSRRGGYGHGVAADVVSVRGETRSARWRSTVELWKWIDAHENEFGIGRPYLDKDPPHVAPIDGIEYAAKRGSASAQHAGLQAEKRPWLAMQDKHKIRKRAAVMDR